jgi:hypothetical protein
MTYVRTRDGLWHAIVDIHVREPILTARLACGPTLPITCEVTRIPYSAPCCDCVPETDRPVLRRRCKTQPREALFYTDREGRPVLRVEIRAEDRRDGRSGFLYAIGLDAMMTTTAALADSAELHGVRLGTDEYGCGYRLILRGEEKTHGA